MWESIVAGTAVAALNGLGAWWTIHWTSGKSFQTFVKVFMGGMVIRLPLVAATSFVLLQFTSLHKGWYACGLIAFFVIFQVAEIAFVLREHGKEKEASG